MNTRTSTCRHKPLAVFWIASLYSLLFPAIGSAEMPIVTLSQLIAKSEIILYGRVDPALPPAAELVSFRAEVVLKGNTIVPPGNTLLCNPNDHGEESPDLSKLQGNIVIFLSKRGDCFDLSYGSKSIVDITGERANTSAIEGELASQPLDHFLKKVRAMARMHAPVSH
jgi:hypothetical protein